MHGRPQTFFQGRAKFSRGRGGGKHAICYLVVNILFFAKKVEKHTILAGQGGTRAPSCPPLRTPMRTRETSQATWQIAMENFASSFVNPNELLLPPPPIPEKPLRFRKKQLESLLSGTIKPRDRIEMKEVSNLLDRVVLEHRAQVRSRP